MSRNSYCVRLGLLAVMAAAVLSGCASADDEAAKAIRAVLAAQVTAWNQGKLEQFMAGYWKSDELRYVSGKTEVRGWKSLLERYRKRYLTDKKEMGKLSFSEIDVRALGEGHALVYGRWRVEIKGETHQGAFTLVMKQFPEGWRIVHDHTSS